MDWKALKRTHSICSKRNLLKLNAWKVFCFFLNNFWCAPFGYFFFLFKYCIDWTRIGYLNRPGMALTPFPSSVGYKIWTHDLSIIVNLVCYPLDQAFALRLKSKLCKVNGFFPKNVNRQMETFFGDNIGTNASSNGASHYTSLPSSNFRTRDRLFL